MEAKLSLDKCVPFLDSEFRSAGRGLLPASDRFARPVVTISRQSGCGALAVAEKAAAYLEARGHDDSCP